MADPKIPTAKPYWPLLRILGVDVDLSHLEPITLLCATKVRDDDLRINVRFSNHCFSEEFIEGVHDENLVVMDHEHKRKFDHFRHSLSRNFPGIIQRLPEVRVHQTYEQRNYVYGASVTGIEGQIYEVYFTLKKASGHIDLHLFVESAYVVVHASPRVKRPNAVRFAPR